MKPRNFIIGAVVVIFGAANIYNIFQGGLATDHINQFITLSSGDPNSNYTPYDPNKTIGSKGETEYVELTCYKLKCSYYPLMGPTKPDSWNEYYSTKKEQDERAAERSRGGSANYTMCLPDPVKMPGQKCVGNSNNQCSIVDCSNTI